MYSSHYQNRNAREARNTPSAIAVTAISCHNRKPLTNSLIFITFILLALSLNKLSLGI